MMSAILNVFIKRRKNRHPTFNSTSDMILPDPVMPKYNDVYKGLKR